MEALIQKIPRVPTPIKKSLPHSYADSPFVDSIALIEMPRKFSFPNMKMYDGTTDPTDHIASYKQRMFTAAIPRGTARGMYVQKLRFQPPRPSSAMVHQLGQ